MTSRSFSEEDLNCPVCLDIFIDPVLLSCTHNICKHCLQRFWEKRGHKACPLCRRRVSKEPPLNMNLRNLCVAYQEERRRKSSIRDEAVCSLHKEKLKLFCLDDQQAVCLVCRDSRKHTNHSFCPIDEALTDNKEKLQDLLNHLQEKLIKFEDFKQNLDKSAKHIKAQAQCTEKQIKEEFEKLHQLLRDEEANRITALREEEKQKSQKMIDRIEETSKQIVYLTRSIRDTEEQMKAGEDSFLRDLKDSLKRGQHGLSDAENVSEMLIDVPKHLSNLKFTVLQKIQEDIKYKAQQEQTFKDESDAATLRQTLPDLTPDEPSEVAALPAEDPAPGQTDPAPQAEGEEPVAGDDAAGDHGSDESPNKSPSKKKKKFRTPLFLKKNKKKAETQ